ncbi:MAG TPA: aquaporin, partial [Thermomicrobiaceae bacterium]|nr:aquaporin [Thermomicrobiaceae bacterium]
VAVAVGLTVAFDTMIRLPVSGASMNPARSFGPAVVLGDLHGLWICVVGPLVGAAAAVALVRVLSGPPNSPEANAARK